MRSASKTTSPSAKAVPTRLDATAGIAYRSWTERLTAADGRLPDRVRYTRKSTAGDERQAASHDQQAMEAEKEWGPLDRQWWWQDSATGTTFDRPAFQDLLAFCRANPRPKASPGHVEFYDPSRFGRTLDETGEPDPSSWHTVYSEFERLNWQVRFVTVKRTGNVLADMMTTAAHAYSAAIYSSNLSKSVRRGRADHAAKGWWVYGSAPWGTKRKDTRTGRVLEHGEPSTPGGGGTILIPDPKTITEWTRGAKRILAGAALEDVGAALFEQGLRGPRGGHLGHSSILNFLTNRALIGEVKVPGESDAAGKRLPKVVKAKWEPMVDIDLFEQVSQRLGGHTRADKPRRRRRRELYPLTPVCAHCGVEYNGNRLPEQQGSARGYTHAQPKARMDEEVFARHAAAGCKAWYVDAEELEEKIKDIVVSARTSEDFLREVRAFIQERDTFRRSAGEAVALAEEDLNAARAASVKIARLMAKVGASEDDEDAFAEEVAAAKQRVRAAEAELEKARKFALSKEDAWKRLEAVVHETRNLAAAWDSAGPEERRILLDYWVLDVLIVVEPIPGMKRANRKTALVRLRSAPDAPRHFELATGNAQRADRTKASSAEPSSARTPASDSASTRSRRAAAAAAPPTRPSAQAACDRTSGSSSESAATSAGTSSAEPTLPSTTAELRLSPRNFARFIGDPLNAAENSDCDIASRVRERALASLSDSTGRGANDGSDSSFANLWLYGQTS